MNQYACSLYRDLANPCYRKKTVRTSELKEGTYMLFGSSTWKMLVQVKEKGKNRSSAGNFLQIDILAFGGCQVPERKSDIYLCGVDTQVMFDEKKLICIPFLQIGQGILLCEETCDSKGQLGGLFYNIADMFILDSSKFC